MPSEKFFVHKEDGSLVRLKGRLVRFLDEEPPTGSDKSAIRTALEVSPDAEGLVQADVGTGPQNLVLHQHLGTMAYADADGVSVATLEVTDKVDGTLNVESTDGLVASFERTGNAKLKVHADSSGPFFDTETGHNLRIFTNGSEAVRVNGSGNTGFGQPNPSSKVDVNGVLTVDSDYPPTSAVGGLNLGDYQSGGYKWIQSLNSQPLHLNPTGNNVHIGANLVMSSGGIDFGSTTTGTGTPSGGLLSDYEEGTFTPSLQFGGGDTGITYSARSGYYTKVGRLVTVHYYIVLTSKGTSTGNASITGGPFVSAFNGGGLAASVIHSYYMASLTGTPFANQGMYSNTVLLWDTVASGRDPLTDANFSNTSAIDCTLTFEV